jgi:Tol biopolymer transport system component/predicted Ser/Thr protein kinase
MAILPGRRLGPYEILSAIGAGGMGEVYKARDTRLDRIVAIKVLPAHLADRAELRERFEREAKTIASLNHPHICTLYDTGHQDGIDFLVMEYLEGETLAQRLVKGSLPLEQVLQYAIEIADALDKAHRKGVTHRDLKPGNIMLTKSGTKLLDFGLAKLKQEIAPAIPDSQLPTMKSAITGEGTILGTLQYMAPEQVEAKEVDARTDIFAFGAVVYEMATGKKAFEGKTSASVMAKILEAEPPSMVSLQPMTPPALDRVVKKCLAKEPEKRWQVASDLCDELKWIVESSGQTAAISPAVSAHKNRRKTLAWVAAGVVACAIVGIAAWMLKPAPLRPVTRFAMSLPNGLRLLGGQPIAISPDGKLLVYAAGESTAATQLYVRAMDGLEARPIPGTEGALNPCFSPDGQWVAFSAGGKLKKVLLSGGAPVSLADFTTGGVAGFSISWSSQGTIAFARPSGPLQQIPDGGGNPQPLTHLEKGEYVHIWPGFLPSGKGVLFVAFQSASQAGYTGNSKVAAQSLGTGERRDLLPGAATPSYAPTGHLVYVQGGNLMAAPFDPKRFALTGAGVPVIEGVLAGQYSFSNTGSLIYVPGSVQTRQLKLVWVDRKGTEQPVAAPAHNYVLPKVSPDGKRVAVGIEEADNQIWLYDLSRDTLTRLTFEGTNNVDPIWTPDGKRIAFKGAEFRLFWEPADGSGPAEELTKSELSSNNVPGSFSPDGQVLVFMERNPNTDFDLYTLPLKDSKPQPFVRTPSNETAPRFSPDGHFIAYASSESGRFEIYVRPYPGPGGKWQISTEGGGEPVWNPKGRELFYRSGNKMMAVDVTTQPTFSAGKPKMLFEGPYVPTPRSFPDYDVSPDGQRFLMLKANEQAQAPAQINVVLNWFEELKQKVPVGKK